MSRRKRHQQHEEHENHERWLVTYADMVTLLMVLFIVMFAMSQVDQRKFNELKQGLAAGFGQSTSIEDGSSSILTNNGISDSQPIAPAAFSATQITTPNPAAQTPALTSAVSAGIAAHEDAVREAERLQAIAEVNRLEDLVKRLDAALRKHGLQSDVKTTINDRGLVVSLVSRHVVFDPNVASLTARGQELVDTLAPVLADLPDPLEIDGHTNQVNVKPLYYASDWDLSAARAVTVLRRLNEQDGIPADRLSAAAFGHTRPLVNPSLPGSQEVNKRVDIVILSTLPSETRSMIEGVLQSRHLTGAGGGLS
jgi:chemotaxis protein MotB